MEEWQAAIVTGDLNMDISEGDDDGSLNPLSHSPAPMILCQQERSVKPFFMPYEEVRRSTKKSVSGLDDSDGSVARGYEAMAYFARVSLRNATSIKAPDIQPWAHRSDCPNLQEDWCPWPDSNQHDVATT